MTEAMSERRWRTTPRWVKWVLGASLAVNFVIIGLGAGAALRFHHHGFQHGGLASIGQIMDALPGDRRDAARDMLKAARPELKAMREERRKAHHSLAAVISAAPFDPDAARTAFAELRAKDNLAKARAHDIIAEVLTLLSDEERGDVAERLNRVGKWR